VLLPTRGKYLCKVLTRERKLPSGLYLADRIKSEKKDNVALCVGVGGAKIGKNGKKLPILAGRGDIVHYKYVFAVKVRWQGENYVFLRNEDIIAIEDDAGKVKAVGSMVIAKLEYAKKSGSIIIPESVKQNSGDFKGVVVSVGPEYPDKVLKVGDEIVFLRGEGYVFRTLNGNKELLAIKECWVYGKEKNA
jgi:chaperonin GroES